MLALSRLHNDLSLTCRGIDTPLSSPLSSHTHTHASAIFNQFTVTACNQLVMAFSNSLNRRSEAGTCSCVYREGKSNVWDEPVNKSAAEGERKVRRGSWEKRIGSLARFQPGASIPFFQSTLGIGDWVGGKAQSNLPTHMHTQTHTHPKPLWLYRPEMCTQTFLFWLMLWRASGYRSLYESQHARNVKANWACVCRRVCWYLRGCVCFNACVCVCVSTQRLWMGLIEDGPPCSGCASPASTWVVLQPHHRPDGPSDNITHPAASHNGPTDETQCFHIPHCIKTADPLKRNTMWKVSDLKHLHSAFLLRIVCTLLTTEEDRKEDGRGDT